jgi:enamine deaminase RidA (YjgF/YER057c/UK114 family)
MAAAESTGKREVVRPKDVPEPLMAYSPAVKAGGWVFVAGQTASDFIQGIAPEARVDPASPYIADSLELQSRYTFRNLARTLEAAGCGVGDIARIYVWLPSARPTYDEFRAGSSTTDVHVQSYLSAFNEAIPEPRPASTAMGIRRLLPGGTRIELDLIAIEPRDGVTKQGFEIPPGVPPPVAKYSPAVRIGDWVFLAGDLATDFHGDFGRRDHLGEPSAVAPEARVNPYFWYGSSIEAQTDYLLAKLEKIAASAGASLDRCVQADVYIGHPQDLAGIERVWRRWFPENPPARTVVPYCGLAARGCRIEIAMKLLASDSPLQRETIETSDAPEPFLHEPQAVRAGDFLFFSTQLPVDSAGRVPKELLRDPSFPHYGEPPKLQLRYMLNNVAAICAAAGTSLDQLCRRQAFFADFDDFPPSMQEWQAHFPVDPPASTAVELGEPLIAEGAHLLLDLVGYAPR